MHSPLCELWAVTRCLPHAGNASPKETSAVLPHEIQDRRFATAFRGYDPTEVRQFLAHVAGLYGDLQGQLTRSGVGVAVPVHDGDAAALMTDGVGVSSDSDRLEADELRAAAQRDAQRQADDLLASARTEAQTIVSRASDEAARIVLRARAESRGKPSAERNAAIEAALAEVPGDPEHAREQARLMISEARAVRERILGDLAKRRRTAHVQLEQLRVAREKLLETLRDARRVVEDASRDLSTAEVEARLAAETAGRRVANEAMPGVQELEAELFGGRYAVSPSAAGGNLTENVAAEVVVSYEVTEVTETVETVDLVEVISVTELMVTELMATEVPVDVESDAAPRAVVDDLFARLRAERTQAADLARVVLAESASTKPKRPRTVKPTKFAPADESDPSGEVVTFDRTASVGPMDGTGVDEGSSSVTADLGRRATDIEAVVAHRLARTIKRHLSDEQGGALVAVRTARGVPHIDAMVGTSDEQRARLADAISVALADAPEHPSADYDGVVRTISDEVRVTLVEALSQLAAGTIVMADLPEAIAASYRAWTTDRLDSAVRLMAPSAA